MIHPFDITCAEILGISIQAYASKITSISDYKSNIIIDALLSPDLSIQQRGIKAFNNI